jgi:hypothetical protein
VIALAGGKAEPVIVIESPTCALLGPSTTDGCATVTGSLVADAVNEL